MRRRGELTLKKYYARNDIIGFLACGMCCHCQFVSGFKQGVEDYLISRNV